MVCNGCSLNYSVVVIATVPSRNPKDGDLGEIAGSLQFQALKPDLLWIFQNRSSPLNRTCSVCGLAPCVMLYRLPFPEDGMPKCIVFYGNAMRLALGTSIKEIISGMPDVSQCAFNSWRIPKREATEAEVKARPVMVVRYSSSYRLPAGAIQSNPRCVYRRSIATPRIKAFPLRAVVRQAWLARHRVPPVDADCASCAACIHSSFAKSCAGCAGCGGSDSKAAEERRRP